MEVPGFLIAETINISVAQRLLRLLCEDCKAEAPISLEDFPKDFKLPKSMETHYTPVGCEECYHTGYKGRKAIYEILPITSEVSEAIKSNTIENSEVVQIETLADKAFQLFYKGITSLDEIYPILINS